MLACLEQEEEPYQAGLLAVYIEYNMVLTLHLLTFYLSVPEDAEWLQLCRSRLSMSLAEVIADKGALGYYIQYLEARSLGALIRFYLDVDCFRSAALEDARATRAHEHLTTELKANSTTDCDNFRSSSVCNQIDHEISVNTKDKDLQTDTEINESASVRNDAVRIFEKYLGLNAPLPVPVEEDVRNSVALALCREGDLDPECFSTAQNACYEIMEEE